MRIPFKSTVLAAAVAAMASVPLVWADDDMPDTDTSETEVVEVADAVPSERIIGYFSEFFGEETETVASGLRNGTIQYVEPVPETEEGGTETDTETETDAAADAPEVEDGAESGTGMGWGNVVISMALAEQLAGISQAEALEGEEGMTANESLNEVLRMRQVEGMGWGQIAKAMGVNLGEVMSGIHSNRPEMAEKLAKDDARAERAADRELARAERMEKIGKPEKVAKMDRPERPVRPEKAERPEKPQRPERPGR
ncbi:hypothetical protein [Microbulbifer hydrolyticus]|uniref:DNA-binding protein (UPF0251 family) n=1 Tax=Microbulbifer hydrolyticus TaxID=48074 RepID=A0A6P1TE73_9GAMM|nr:hypothetical protein [Microbulbifer hydrolyticus]MBB5210478.1 putative DNA-binding protein (UPF0251 family) [Microbulbifer hydrolyticus]QHQ39042.1 hypothetical protein GTQ55_08630 [Microbulbifer hydrolyticus]